MIQAIAWPFQTTNIQTSVFFCKNSLWNGMIFCQKTSIDWEFIKLTRANETLKKENKKLTPCNYQVRDLVIIFNLQGQTLIMSNAYFTHYFPFHSKKTSSSPAF